MSSRSVVGENTFELGIYDMNNGNIEKACDIRLMGWNRFNIDNSYQVSPNCGLAFIRTVTAPKKGRLYIAKKPIEVSRQVAEEHEIYCRCGIILTPGLQVPPVPIGTFIYHNLN